MAPTSDTEVTPVESPRLGRQPRVGDWVLFRLDSGNCRGETRPAVVVRSWPSDIGTCNMQVFLDGSNDGDVMGQRETEALHAWRTSVVWGQGEGQWSWRIGA